MSREGISDHAMLIVCPACASQYQIDEAKIGEGGRKVRCAACGAAWHVEAPAAASDDLNAFPEAPDADETRALLDEELSRAAEVEAEITALAAEREAALNGAETVDPPAPQAKKPVKSRKKPAAKRGGKGLRGIALPAGLALAGLVLLGGLVWQRDLAVRGAPQLASVFKALGLPVNARGFSLSAVESGLVQENDGRFLVVEGDVTNITRRIATVPPIEVAVTDAGGQVLYRWTTEPAQRQLEPSELMRFRARLATPPEEGRAVTVRFATSQAVASLH